MMHGKRVIGVLLTAAASAALLFASATPDTPEYLDDVYYWPSDEKARDVAAEEPAEVVTAEPKTTRIIFLDDSITRQNPDTVVRVRIKRN